MPSPKMQKFSQAAPPLPECKVMSILGLAKLFSASGATYFFGSGLGQMNSPMLISQ
jgi:hypothetical protein